MKKVLIKEICNEKPNSQSLGAYNRAVEIVNSGRSGGESVKQVFDYFKITSTERARRSREAFDKPIYR